MPLYDFLAPVYDLAFERIYRPFRLRALEQFPLNEGASILDLACGTGQNFPQLAERIGEEGHIVGVDISSGMLRRAQSRVPRMQAACGNQPKISLLQMDAIDLTTSALEARTGLSSVDFIICTYSFTSMRNWEAAFRASWALLKPGGGYLIHDIAAEKRTPHVLAVEMATRSHFFEKVWLPLQSACVDFRMDYLDPSAHLFGGRLFVAQGTKPLSTKHSSHAYLDQQRRQAARALQP